MWHKKPDDISVSEALHMHRRGYKLLKKRCPGVFVSSLVCAVSAAATPYAGIYLSARIINELAGERRPEVLYKLIIITIAVTSVLALVNAVLSRWKNCRQDTVWCRKRKLYADKMLDMDFAAMDETRTHELRSQIIQNEQYNGWGLGKIPVYYETLVNAVISILGAVALTISLFVLPVPADAGKIQLLNHPVSVAGMIALLVFVTLIAPVCMNKADSYWAKYSNDARLSNRIFSYFGFMAQEKENRADVRMYNQQEICAHYYKKDETFGTKSGIAKAAVGPMGLWAAASAAVSVVFTGIVYVFVCLKAWAGAFGAGSVTQYIASITALSRGVASFVETVGDMKNNAVFLKTTFAFLDIPDLMYQGSLTTEKRSDCNYEVEFRDVSFKYPGSESYALRHVSMKFRIGQRLAVVGMNGSGKTTFIKLLCRLYDPTEGEILLNGINIRKYKYDDYMALFSVVFQDFGLLSFPVGQNVAASEKYDRAKVRDCLEKAGLSERISEMSDGMDTYLYKDFNSKGVEISGGEAQKTAIARALYKDAPFIILDEPTAALDPVAEAEVYSKFNDIAGDKTAVYISHRLSSCRFCDAIVVFDGGRIVQQGSHEKLVADEDGKYHELWYAQARYYVV